MDIIDHFECFSSDVVVHAESVQVVLISVVADNDFIVLVGFVLSILGYAKLGLIDVVQMLAVNFVLCPLSEDRARYQFN